mgnify:CR=1 FL=1
MKVVIRMNRMIYLVIFLIKNYWRKTNFIFQFLIFAIVCGYFIDPRYAPYSHNFIILIKNFLLIIIALITTFQMNKINYDRSIYVLLNRVKRKLYYISTAISAFVIVLGFSILLDVYVLIFSGLSFYNLFTFSLIFYSIINISLTIMVINMFSVYTVAGRYQIVGLIVIGFGLIPKWYKDLPFEKILYYLKYVIPPIGNNILIQQNKTFFSWSLLLSFLYLLIVYIVGVNLFKKRNLSDLK